MFNHVVKDPNPSGLSRELWIKNKARINAACVLELYAIRLLGSAYRSRVIRTLLNPFNSLSNS